MNPITLHLIMDVHNDSIARAIAPSDSKSRARLLGTITNDLHAVEKALARLLKGRRT